MSIGTLSYKTLSGKSLYNNVLGSYRTPVTLTTLGTISVSTSTKKFGAGSIFYNATGFVYAASGTNFNFGTGDFTIEGWFNWSSNAGTQFLLDQRANAVNGFVPVIYATVGQLYYYLNGAARITASFTPNVGQWYHIAVCRASGVTKMFIDGTQVGSSYTDANTYVTGGVVNIGNTYNLGVSIFSGYIDEVRITKGYAWYPSNFTAPTSSLINTSNVSLLIKADDTIRDYVV